MRVVDVSIAEMTNSGGSVDIRFPGVATLNPHISQVVYVVWYYILSTTTQ